MKRREFYKMENIIKWIDESNRLRKLKEIIWFIIKYLLDYLYIVFKQKKKNFNKMSQLKIIKVKLIRAKNYEQFSWTTSTSCFFNLVWIIIIFKRFIL